MVSIFLFRFSFSSSPYGYHRLPFVMYSLGLHGIRRFFELQKRLNLRVSVNPLINSSAFSSSFSSTLDSDVSLRDGRKGQNFTVSYLVDSLGLTSKVADFISRKGNPESVLNLLRSHEFTDSQISTIITTYPRLLIADAEKSLAPKLQFLKSGASSSEVTEILSKVPKILGKKGDITISRYYDFVKEIVKADKCSKFEKLCQSSLPQGHLENKFRNLSVLRELGVPQKRLFDLLFANYSYICGKEKFEESLKKVVEMGFDPTTLNFVQALRMLYGMSDKTIEEKVQVYKSVGFTVEDIWAIFKKSPFFLAHSEKKILSSIETFLGLGFSRDEIEMMVKLYPDCIGKSAESVKKKTEFLVKKMNWPLKQVVLHPQVFSYSMEKRIVPRCNVIKSLKSKGLLGEGGTGIPRMTSVLTCTNEDFLKRFVRKHDDKHLVTELMAIFT